MNEGNIVKCITKFAIPCILMRIIQNIYPLLDSLIVGNLLNINMLASVGIAGTLYSLFNDTLLGLVSGFAIVASNKVGSKNTHDVTITFSNSLIASVIICIVLSLVGISFSEKMFLLLETPSDLIKSAKEYIFVLFLGFVPNMLYNFLCEMLRAIGDSKTPLLLLIISSVIHLLLLPPLTICFGVCGTALSNVISYLIAVALGFIYIHKKIPDFRISFTKFKFNKRIMKECFNIGIPMSITNFVTMLGVLTLNFVTNTIGTEYVAAYSCASKVGYIITTPIFGFSTAVSVFVAQNFGAKNFKRINQGIKSTLKIISIVNLFIAVFSVLLSGKFFNIILKEDIVAVNAGVMYIFIRCVSMTVLTPAAVYKGVLPAVGKPFLSTLSGFIEVAVRFLFPLIFTDLLGFAAVPLTDSFTWLLLAIILSSSFYYVFKKIPIREDLSNEKSSV